MHTAKNRFGITQSIVTTSDRAAEKAALDASTALLSGFGLGRRSAEGNTASRRGVTAAERAQIRPVDRSAGKDTFYIQMKPNAKGTPTYRMVSEHPQTGERVFRSIKTSPGRWNASFINRKRSNIADYKKYNFNRPDAVDDLGDQNKNGSVVASLYKNYGMGRPAKNIKTRHFAMEAWTRVKLDSGMFYQITSDSDDGVRFFFKDTRTGEIETTLSGDWRNRSVRDPSWTQTISAGEGGTYDFYIQYYERTGASVVDVKLERVTPTGEVQADTLNLRGTPSTVNNSPIATLRDGDSFKVLRVVKSSNDNNYPTWYQIETNSGQQGYVAADSDLVSISNQSKIVTVGEGGVIVDPPTGGGNEPPLGGGGSPNPGKGYQFSTTLSRSNPYYLPHLDEITDPQYYSTSYKPLIERAVTSYSWLQPSVIAAIGSRESAWGLLLYPAGPSGTGDGGHGRGLMQIDDRFHDEFISSGKWRDPAESIKYGIEAVLAPNYNYLARNTNLKGVELLRGALASYNAGLGNVMDAIESGLDVDYYTTGQDYGWDVLNRAGWFQLHGWN